MTTLPGWDESARPAPPAYPDASPGELAPARHLRAIHEMFRDGLATVAEVVDRLVDGEAEVGQARAAVHALGLTETYQQLGSWCGQICHAVRGHHSFEDAYLYPPLRFADTGLHEVLDRLSYEHEVIHEVLERLDRSLVEAARDPAVVGRLAEEFRHLRALLLSHFDYEEDGIGTAIGVHGVLV
jgi:Hemerythrin HHE cation binding domain